MVERIERLFPKLCGTNWRVSSPFDRDYNCVAWAAGDTNDWWWPVSLNRPVVWPASAPAEITLAAFEAAFACLGYARCDNEGLEPGVEKVALFVGADGRPCHAARQIATGIWTSKLGAGEDVEHPLRDLEGDVYGTVTLVLGRPRPTAGNVSPTAPAGPAS
jgi:hypothetical protein